ncbi:MULTISPECIES: shikimate kinase [Acinetobacter]|uniref:shikimate kinase n=1 Tax=Acinetobacter TaxID=469 RepID=UPI00051C37DD|nr:MULTISPECIES: shikimate kinase [Acinetobacter]MCH7316881.1 hypothetical protein [Acinetobacter higginsii]MCH7379600.1 hypothetical protein [Acinetobacter higginsii]
MLIYFIGPGGAGKTTVAKLLSAEFGFDYYDLDEYFMQSEGDITQYIIQHGYKEYAARNIQLFMQLQIKYDLNKIMIIVCSSGFMAYPHDIQQDYMKIKDEIESHIFTFLMLPSLALETYVQEIVARQMNRAYLNPVRAKEELKIRQRFQLYSNLKCRVLLTDQIPDQVAANVKQILDTLNKVKQGSIELSLTVQ